eukprot:m.293434 g.293434  ORF g.293434 m.293434 type:complete len:633 (-) comp23412_c0_seq1:86-1984(-)
MASAAIPATNFQTGAATLRTCQTMPCKPQTTIASYNRVRYAYCNAVVKSLPNGTVIALTCNEDGQVVILSLVPTYNTTEDQVDLTIAEHTLAFNFTDVLQLDFVVAPDGSLVLAIFADSYLHIATCVDTLCTNPLVQTWNNNSLDISYLPTSSQLLNLALDSSNRPWITVEQTAVIRCSTPGCQGVDNEFSAILRDEDDYTPMSRPVFVPNTDRVLISGNGEYLSSTPTPMAIECEDFECAQPTTTLWGRRNDWRFGDLVYLASGRLLRFGYDTKAYFTGSTFGSFINSYVSVTWGCPNSTAYQPSSGQCIACPLNNTAPGIVQYGAEECLCDPTITYTPDPEVGVCYDYTQGLPFCSKGFALALNATRDDRSCVPCPYGFYQPRDGFTGTQCTAWEGCQNGKCYTQLPTTKSNGVCRTSTKCLTTPGPPTTTLTTTLTTTTLTTTLSTTTTMTTTTLTTTPTPSTTSMASTTTATTTTSTTEASSTTAAATTTQSSPSTSATATVSMTTADSSSSTGPHNTTASTHPASSTSASKTNSETSTAQSTTDAPASTSKVVADPTDKPKSSKSSSGMSRQAKLGVGLGLGLVLLCLLLAAGFVYVRRTSTSNKRVADSLYTHQENQLFSSDGTLA